MSQRIRRRTFLQTTAAASAGYWVAGGLQAEENTSPNERIQFACIGIGGKGSSDSADAKKHGEVVAICDIDQKRLDAAEAKKFPGATKFFDYRELFDKLGDKIDAVTVSTPDHHHAHAAARALELKKHCFCQKPLTHSIWESRLLSTLARDAGVATQMGNQGTALASLRKAAAIVKSGVLGPIKEVHVWTNRPVWPQGGPRPDEIGVPEHVKWDLFLGPAPYRPYGNGYHPFAWRGWWDFGTGALGDMACHTFNLPYFACDLKDPTSVEAESAGHNRDSYPKWSVINFEFPANDARGPVKVTWYDGGKQPNNEIVGGRDLAASGAAIVGENGTLYSPGDYAGSYELIGDIEEPKVEYVESPGHFVEFVRAIKGGEPATSNFPDYAGGLTETILLGNLAVFAADQPGAPGKKIEWDAKALEPTNAPELASIVRRQYRDGYTLDELNV